MVRKVTNHTHVFFSMDMPAHYTIDPSKVRDLVMAFKNVTDSTEEEVSMINERHARLETADIGDLFKDVCL